MAGVARPLALARRRESTIEWLDASASDAFDLGRAGGQAETERLEHQTLLASAGLTL